MGITLYSSIVCPWAARTWLALIEAKVEFELVEIDLSVPREPWYLEQINSVGKVPALKLEDGKIICESAVCAEYVADLTGKLLPKDPLDRSVIRFFIETFTAKFPPAMYSILLAGPEKQRETVTSAIKTVNDLLKEYLHGGPFLLGSSDYTLAEVECVPFIARFDMLGRAGYIQDTLFQEILRKEEFKPFYDYLKNCLARDSHKQIWHEAKNREGAERRLKALKKSTKDRIFVQDLRLHGKAGLSSFAFTERQFPVSITMSVFTERVNPHSDEYTISYGDVARELSNTIDQGNFPSLEEMALTLTKAPSVAGRWDSLRVEKEGGILRAAKEVIEAESSGAVKITIKGICVGCIIGIYDHERVKKQDVLFDLVMSGTGWGDDKMLMVEQAQRGMVEQVIEYVGSSALRTVEALAQHICEISLKALPDSVTSVSVWLSKPSALVFAQHSGVILTRNR